jgi:hypothetical protein
VTGLLIAVVLLLLVIVGPAVYEAIVYRRRADADDTRQAAAYWDALEAFHVRLDDNPEATAADAAYRDIQKQRARHAAHPSDLPHGTTPRRYP